jgi:hypothetical protein
MGYLFLMDTDNNIRGLRVCVIKLLKKFRDNGLLADVKIEYNINDQKYYTRVSLNIRRPIFINDVYQPYYLYEENFYCESFDEDYIKEKLEEWANKILKVISL